MANYLHLVAENCVQEALWLGCGLSSCQPLQNSGNKQPGTGTARSDSGLEEYPDGLGKLECFFFFFFYEQVI